jgi:hypothetical protein
VPTLSKCIKWLEIIIYIYKGNFIFEIITIFIINIKLHYTPSLKVDLLPFALVGFPPGRATIEGCFNVVDVPATLVL